MAKKKVGVTIEEDLHADMKSRAPKMKLLLEEAYEAALHLWLKSTDPATVIPPIDAKPEEIHNISTAFGKHRRWHEALDRVLRSGNRVAIQAVIPNLVAFDELVRGRTSAGGAAMESEPDLSAEVAAILAGETDDRGGRAADVGRPRKRRGG